MKMSARLYLFSECPVDKALYNVNYQHDTSTHGGSILVTLLYFIWKFFRMVEDELKGGLTSTGFLQLRSMRNVSGMYCWTVWPPGLSFLLEFVYWVVKACCRVMIAWCFWQCSGPYRDIQMIRLYRSSHWEETFIRLFSHINLKEKKASFICLHISGVSTAAFCKFTGFSFFVVLSKIWTFLHKELIFFTKCL